MSQHSSSVGLNSALKMIRTGDSESFRHTLSNGIVLIHLYDKVKFSRPHSQLETPGTLSPLPPRAVATLPPRIAPAMVQE